MVEYEACAMGIMMAHEHQIKELNVFGDSALVIYQLHGEWETRDTKLILYHSHIMEMSETFDKIRFHYGAYPKGVNENDKRMLRRLASDFFLSGAILYKRSSDSMLLRCIDDHEAKGIMEEVHKGTFGTHANDHALAHKILKASYYWTKMESNCYQHMKCQIYADNIHVAPSALHNLTSP
ncbi:hypothetical protein CR513_09193, partial [Mucuna pruriens]